MSTIWDSNGWFHRGDVTEWRTDLVEWAILPTVLITVVLSVCYCFELCVRKLSLNRPGVRIKTLSRKYVHRTKNKKSNTGRNYARYRYETKDHAVYFYDQVDEFYPYNRVYMYLTWHVVSLGFCLHHCHDSRLVWCTYIHMFFFLIYIWLEVSFDC